MRTTMLRVIGSMLAVAALHVAAPVPARAQSFDHPGLAREVIERHIRPAAAALADKAQALAQSLAEHCEAPERVALAAVREHFAGAALAYARLEPLRFGPTRQANRQERLLFYPDPKGLARRQVGRLIASEDPAALEAASLYGKSVAVQGFTALELLLTDPPTDGLGLGADDTGYRCRYAAAVGANIAAIAAAIDAEWSDPAGYSKLMLEPGIDNPAYLEPSEVTLEIAKAFLEGLESVRDVRLLAPLGLREVGKPPTPGLLEPSGLALRYLGAGLEGLRDLYEQAGLADRAAVSDKAMAKVVSTEIGTALRSLAGVAVDLGEARTREKPRKALVMMAFPLKNAAAQAADLLASAAGLSLGFNAGDGD